MSDLNIQFLMEQIRYTVPQAISDGIRDGLATVRRPVLYRVYKKIPSDKLKLHQAEGSFAWSEEEYPGKFIEFAHFQDNETESEMIIEKPDGTLCGASLSKVRFADL